MILSAALFIILGLSAVASQDVNVNCHFLVTAGIYSCQISSVIVTNNENPNFIIGGTHSTDRNDDDVQRVTVMLSLIPTIIQPLFTTFPNLIYVTVTAAGLTRIQPEAFANASNLNYLTINGNANLRAIPANAFLGASALNILDIFGNQIETVDETAFNGLQALSVLYMDDNLIEELPANLFRPLTSLEIVFLSDNRLQSLDGRLFANNPAITTLQIGRNQINAIGRNFFDSLSMLSVLNLSHNVCVNNFWIINDVSTIDLIREVLSECFDNFVEPDDDVRTFILELRGSLILRDQNGTEIIRL